MRIRAQRRLPAIGLGVTLCAMAIMTIQSAVSAPHEPEVTVGPWELSHSVVFRIPSVPSSTWVWRMLVGTVDNWCHIEGSLSSPGGWEDHFGREVSFFTLGSADTPWDAFQPEFDGKIEPCGGPGPGPGEVVIHDWDVDGTGKFDYFIQPHNKVACVGTEVTFRSYIWDEEDGTKQSVSSDWEVYGYPQYNTTNTVSITFTPDEPDTYTVKGTAVSAPELTDSAQVNVVKVEMTNPKMDKKFKFDDDDPGKLMIEFSAVIHPDTEVTRKFLDGKIKFEIDAIGESTLTWDYAGGLGVYQNGSFANKATFTGLPKYNTDFGVKEVRMIVEGCAAFDANRDISVFYSAYATNHPGGEVSTPPGGGKAIPPNYFYYYMQTTAAAGEPGYSNWGSVAYKAPPYNYYVEAETYGSGMPIVAPGVNGGQTLTYIDLFAWACRHELNHHVLWTEWWGEEGRNKDDDQDGDWIPDELEPDMGTDEGGPYDPTKYRTYDGDDDTHCSDTERHCCMTAEEWAVGTANQEDWAYPGNQWNPDQ